MTSQHRTTADKYGWNIDTSSCHQQARYVLVAVRNHNQCIEVMCQSHTFGRIGNQISGDQRILHANVTHGNAVTDCDCREYDRRTASHGNASFYSFYDFVDVHVTRNNFVIRGNDSDQRPFHFFFGHAECMEKGTLRGFSHTVTIKITCHFDYLLSKFK